MGGWQRDGREGEAGGAGYLLLHLLLRCVPHRFVRRMYVCVSSRHLGPGCDRCRHCRVVCRPRVRKCTDLLERRHLRKCADLLERRRCRQLAPALLVHPLVLLPLLPLCSTANALAQSHLRRLCIAYCQPLLQCTHLAVTRCALHFSLRGLTGTGQVLFHPSRDPRTGRLLSRLKQLSEGRRRGEVDHLLCRLDPEVLVHLEPLDERIEVPHAQAGLLREFQHVLHAHGAHFREALEACGGAGGGAVEMEARRMSRR